MPRLTQPSTIESSAVQFVASPMLDMMNAMYFTGHVTVSEGVEGWPLALRREMAKDFLIELDFAFNYPAGDPGILGTFCDNLFVHPEAWRDLDSLVSYPTACRTASAILKSRLEFKALSTRRCSAIRTKWTVRSTRACHTARQSNSGCEAWMTAMPARSS